MNQAADEAGRFYAKAANKREQAERCCSEPTTALAAGYQAEALDSAPDEAVNTSFGCGNPLAFSEVKEGQTVLDLGCGAGLDLILAAERVGSAGHVIGVDGSHEMLRLAEKHIALAETADVIDLRHGLLEALPVEDHSVDWVISNCVVNLSGDKPKVFSEIQRVLKPGGHVVIADLVAEELPEWVHAHSDLYSACVSGAVSEGDYLELASRAGLVNGSVMGRLEYDEPMIRALINDALPVALHEIAARLDMTEDQLLTMAAADLAGKLRSVRFHFAKPV